MNLHFINQYLHALLNLQLKATPFKTGKGGNPQELALEPMYTELKSPKLYQMNYMADMLGGLTQIWHRHQVNGTCHHSVIWRASHAIQNFQISNCQYWNTYRKYECFHLTDKKWEKYQTREDCKMLKLTIRA